MRKVSSSMLIRDGIGLAGLTPGQPQTVHVQNGGGEWAV